MAEEAESTTTSLQTTIVDDRGDPHGVSYRKKLCNDWHVIDCNKKFCNQFYVRPRLLEELKARQDVGKPHTRTASRWPKRERIDMAAP